MIIYSSFFSHWNSITSFYSFPHISLPLSCVHPRSLVLSLPSNPEWFDPEKQWLDVSLQHSTLKLMLHFMFTVGTAHVSGHVTVSQHWLRLRQHTSTYKTWNIFSHNVRRMLAGGQGKGNSKTVRFWISNSADVFFGAAEKYFFVYVQQKKKEKTRQKSTKIFFYHYKFHEEAKKILLERISISALRLAAMKYIRARGSGKWVKIWIIAKTFFSGRKMSLITEKIGVDTRKNHI